MQLSPNKFQAFQPFYQKIFIIMQNKLSQVHPNLSLFCTEKNAVTSHILISENQKQIDNVFCVNSKSWWEVYATRYKSGRWTAFTVGEIYCSLNSPSILQTRCWIQILDSMFSTHENKSSLDDFKSVSTQIQFCTYSSLINMTICLPILHSLTWCSDSCSPTYMCSNI